MKVLLLGPYPPPHGGVQTNLVAIREYLRERGIGTAVINLTRFRRQDADGVYYPKSAVGVVRLLLLLQYDIVHFHLGGNVTLRLLGLSLVCCLLPGRKAVLTFHSGGYPSSPEGKAARPWTLRGFVFRLFDRIIAVNLEIEEMFHRFGVPPRRISLIYPYAPSVPEIFDLPEPLESFYHSHNPVLLTVGLLEPEYDLESQIEVLELVRNRFPHAGLVIAGAGSLEQKLRAHIAKKPYSEHILLCGDVPHAVALRAIARSRVFLRTTFYDGDSVAVREALHLGTPVIATDNGMRPKGVRLIPVSNLEALLRAIEEILTAPVPKSELPTQNASRNLQAVLDLYEEAIKSR